MCEQGDDRERCGQGARRISAPLSRGARRAQPVRRALRSTPLAASILVALLASAGPARGQAGTDRAQAEDPTAAARALYTEGIELVKKSQWGEALAAFERSAALRPHPVTTYSIGACERALGRYTRARITLSAALAASGTAGALPPSMAQEAQGYLAEIDGLLAHARVTIDPPDAGIAVDGRPLGAQGGVMVAGLAAPGPGTPPPSPSFELVADPGTHVITLSRKGYADVVVSRAFPPGGRFDLKLELSRLPATLHVASNQANAIVTVNGADVGAAPVDVSRPAGSYRVIVKKDGFEAYEAQVSVNAGEEVDLSATLVEKKTAITKKWWFWTGAAAVVAGGVVLTYALTRPDPQPPAYESGSSGWLVTPAKRLRERRARQQSRHAPGADGARAPAASGAPSSRRPRNERRCTMPHWDHRPEPKWSSFEFNQPYEKGLRRLKEDVLGKTDFDPATLWQWGTMQAMALIEILRDCEAAMGADGQALVYAALRRTGLDVGRQILRGKSWPEGMTEAEFVSFYATVINRIAYASLEAPKIDSDDQVSFDILWCPHQDHYGAFDCRVQRYFVQGMIDAATEFAGAFGFAVRFDATIPAGAPTCHFTLWRADETEKQAWETLTKTIEAKALVRARKPAPGA